MPQELRKAVIRTSDRGTFKRCRRKWAWSSGLRQNLRIKDTPSYFWIGTGGHFALEDFHGYNHFGHPVEAFNGYVTATRAFARKNGWGLPDDWEEQQTLGQGILEYYLKWLEHREAHPTVWLDGEPQVEIRCEVPLLNITPPPGYDVVVYQLTLDRLVEIAGEYWITDYKFFKQFKQDGLDLDPQMGAYIWGASTIFEKPISGAIFHEFRKAVPKEPKVLSTGRLSHSKTQGTTHRMYREALIQMYGKVDGAPRANVDCLNLLAMQESAERDNYIKRTTTRRNIYQQQAMGSLILMEAEDMCDPDLPLYPNPTRDCSWDCSLRDICLMVDRDDDWQSLLTDLTVQDTEEQDGWRNHLVLPQ